MIIDQPFGRSFAIVADAEAASRSDLCAVFLNAGAVRRIGPNRTWVEAGRRWAARGVPSARIDFEGIGESDGDAAMFVDVGRFYTQDHGVHLGAVLDALEARGAGPRFVLVGLCAGGYWAFNAAAQDDRVVSAVVLNPRALVWVPDLDERREARQIQRVLEPNTWQGSCTATWRSPGSSRSVARPPSRPGGWHVGCLDDCATRSGPTH